MDETNALFEGFDNGPRKALSAFRKKRPPFLSGFKIYLFSLPKQLIRPITELCELCGAKMLKRQPKPDADAVQADLEIIQSQASFQYTHLIVAQALTKNSTRRGKVATVTVKWLLDTLLRHEINDLN